MISKYRGKILHKTLRENKWIFGDLKTSASTKGNFYITEHSKDSYFEPEVDPITVGQYINTKDQLDKELYPGDLLTSNLYPFDQDDYQIVIVWNKEDITYIGLTLLTAKGIAKHLRGASEGETVELSELRYFKKIGNIFDNPEMVTKQQLKMIKAENKINCYIVPYIKRKK